MTASLAAAAAATLAASFSPDWTTLIALRALTGLALSGVPAVAMAYLAEEMDRSAIGLAMGLYIAGNTLGGMAGRLASAAIADVGGWRGGRRHRRPRFARLRGRVRLRPAEGAAAAAEDAGEQRSCRRFGMHFSDPGLRYLFALGFLLMGALRHHLQLHRLSPGSAAVFAEPVGDRLRVLASISSARSVRRSMGELAGRYGRRRVIGVAIVLMPIGALADLARQPGADDPRRRRRRRPGSSAAIRSPRAGSGFGPRRRRRRRARSTCSSTTPARVWRARSAAGFSPATAWPGVAAFVGALSVARAPRGDEAGARSPAGASSRFVKRAPGHGVARRRAHHRRPQARRAIGDRRGDDPGARPPSRPRPRRALGAVRRRRCSPATRIGLVWRARLDEHLGAYAVEPLSLRAGRLMASALALAGTQLSRPLDPGPARARPPRGGVRDAEPHRRRP